MMIPWLLAQLGGLPALTEAPSAAPRSSWLWPSTECQARGAHATKVWERAKDPGREAYCEALGLASARLVRSPAGASDALAYAEAADRLMPRRGAPMVLKARALLDLGDDEGALRALAEAQSRDEHGLGDAVALWAWARANGRTGHVREAANAYRRLVSLRRALPPEAQESVVLAASLAVLQLGPASLGESLALLRLVRDQGDPWLHIACSAVRALARDRADQRNEARAELAPFGALRAGDVLDARMREVLSDSGATGEAFALRAVVEELANEREAVAAWKEFLAGPGGQGPWKRHAEARVNDPSARGAR